MIIMKCVIYMNKHDAGCRVMFGIWRLGAVAADLEEWRAVFTGRTRQPQASGRGGQVKSEHNRGTYSTRKQKQVCLLTVFVLPMLNTTKLQYKQMVLLVDTGISTVRPVYKCWMFSDLKWARSTYVTPLTLISKA